MFLRTNQVRVLAEIMGTLAESHAERDVRQRVGELMLQLLGAQFYASYVWNAEHQHFDSGVHLNMEPANLARYEQYYQYHDPITLQLQRHRQAVRVVQVMPQAELKRTEFFNDFLYRDGLYWGINLYAWTGNDNIGDMRIWRDRCRDNFTEAEGRLLDLVRPAFTAAIRRCRLQGPAAQGPQGAPPRDADPGAASVLGAREASVARLITQGLPDKEIAQRLGISVTTVRTHIRRMFGKLDVRNRAALVQRLKF